MLDNLRGLIADLLAPNRSGMDNIPTIFGTDAIYQAAKGYHEIAVATGVNEICSGIAQLQATVVDVDNKRVMNHALLTVVNNPNPIGYSSFHLIYSFVGSMLLYGNAYLLVVRSTSGTPTGLRLLNSPDVSVSVNPAGYPIFKYKDSIWYTVDDVLHIVDIPSVAAIGPSRVEQAANLIANKDRADKMIGRTFDAGLHGATVLSVGGDLDAKQVKGIKNRIGHLIKDKSKNKILTMPGGTTIAPLAGPTPADQNLQAYRETTLHEIAAMLGVPPSSIGAITSEKYNNALVKQKAFYKETLTPIKLILDAAFTKLLPAGLFFRLDPENFLLGDAQEQALHFAGLVRDGIICPNEARARLGFEQMDSEIANALCAPRARTGDDRTPATGGADGPGGENNR